MQQINSVSLKRDIYSNPVRKNNTPPNQTPTTEPLTGDTVSFKGGLKTREVNPNKMKAFIAAVVGFLGINTAKKVAESEQKTDVSEDIYTQQSKPLTKAQQLEQELMNKTYEYTYGQDGEYTDIVKSFNETAVKGIVELYEKEGAESAYRLAKILEKDPKASEEVTQFVIDMYATNPEMVNKYSGIYKERVSKHYSSITGMAHLIQSASIDSELTDKTIKAYTDKNPGATITDSDFNDIYKFVSAAQEQDPKIVDKYLKEDRIPFRLTTILDLSKLDKEYSEEIARLLQTLDNVKKYDIDSDFIKNILKDSAENLGEVNAIVKFLGRARAEQVKPLIEAFATDIVLAQEICKKVASEDHVILSGVDAQKAAALTLGVYNNGKKIGQLTGKSWKELSTSQLKEILDVIQNNSDVIDRIIADGRGKDYKNLIDIYRRYPDREITQEFINLAKDPLAKLFDLP